MSSHTWTPNALSSELIAYKGKCWRLVEAQHRVSTLKLVDSLAEQELLEDLIEATKPVLPVECRHLDYLLSTPFRYDAQYPKGSRFRRAGRTPGVFYAAESPSTAVAEMSFHRLLFFAESPETPWPNDAAEYTAFSAALRTDRGLDLTRPKLSRDQAVWMHPTRYGPCQDLADTARKIGAGLIRYRSVRDPGAGANIAVLACSVFERPNPMDRQTWRIRLGRTGIQALCDFPRLRLEFPRAAFKHDPRIAALLHWDR